MDKYLDDEEFEKSIIEPRRPSKPRKQQSKMDEFLFKARRIDKGSREFGLQTIREPKRGSKKKRESIDALEIDDLELKKMQIPVKKKKLVREEEEDWRNSRNSQKNMEDDLDYSLAFESPIQRRQPILRRRNTKITKFMEYTSTSTPKPSTSSVTANNPSAYLNISRDFLDDEMDSTISNTPPKTLMETVPLCTPSPEKKIGRVKDSPIFKWNLMEKEGKSRNIREFTSPQPNQLSGPTSKSPEPYSPMFKKDLMEKEEKSRKIREFTSPHPNQHPGPSSRPTEPYSPIFKKDLMEKREKMEEKPIFQPVMSRKMGNDMLSQVPGTSSSAPDHLPTSSFQYTPEDDLEILEKPRHHRKALSAEESERKEFSRQMTDREKIMRELVGERKFVTERAMEDKRKEGLKDGQVIRDKEMRRNLMHGTACPCCRGYYDGLKMEEEEKKEYIDKVSRHRYVHKPLPDTPPRYWDLTLGPADEMEEIPVENRNWDRTTKNKEEKKKTGIQNW